MATLAKNIIEKFPTLRKHRSKLECGLVSLLTAGGERFFSTAIFQCPCHPTWNLPYGMVFLLVPALGLFLLGYVLNTRTCESQSRKEFLWISATAVVAPPTWVAVGLLGGTFYECSARRIAYLGQHLCLGGKDNCSTLMPKLPCLWDPELDLQDLLKELQAHSQVAGWILIAVAITSLVIGTSITYCRSPFSFMQLKFRNIYVIEEQKSLTKESRKNATELANEIVKCFFEGSLSDHNSTSAEDWQQISPLYTLYSEEQYYTVMHKYVNMRKKGEVASTFNVVEAKL